MSQSAIIPLLKQFREQQISATALHEQLEQIVQLCERKQAELKQTKVVAADQEEWQQRLQPALDLSYQALIGAARLGQEYAKTPSQELAEAIVYAFVQVDKATAFIEERVQGVSAETQAVLGEELSELKQDGSDMQKLLQGNAQTVTTLFDD